MNDAQDNRTTMLVFGGRGMLGRAFAKCARVRAGSDHRIVFANLDVTNCEELRAVINHVQPDWLVNSAAYTNVDGAESECEEAFRVNADAVEEMAEICSEVDIRLLHLSTDYVFGDRVAEHQMEWTERDRPSPVNSYGDSKLAGESAIATSGCMHLIVRSSWMFADHGQNFVRTIIDRLSNGESLEVVDDQIGRPTSADDLSSTLLDLMRDNVHGIVHACNVGLNASWFDLAAAIRDELELPADRVLPCSTLDDPRPARRPAYSALDTTRLERLLPDCACAKTTWRDAVHQVVRSLSETERELPVPQVTRSLQPTPTVPGQSTNPSVR